MTTAISELDEFLDSIPVGDRRARFHDLAEAMLKAERPVWILETGCMRALGNPEGDGCSTLVWDYIAARTKGKCITIDIASQNVEFTKTQVSSYTDVICCESVRFLTSITQLAQPIDFLYLDSMDWAGDLLSRGLSSLHHAAELCAAWPWVAYGGLIAVDDCVGEYAGKHALVHRFFDMIGAEPMVDDYIHVWRKPMPAKALELFSCPESKIRAPEIQGD